jgi:hypothetical protein
VDPKDVWRLNMDLLANVETVVAQLHTHPGRAFHSSTDDAFPLVSTPGFLSIVAPDFGSRGLIELHGCAAFCLVEDGAWRPVGRDVVEWT